MICTNFAWGCRRLQGIMSIRDKLMGVMSCCDGNDAHIKEEYSNLLEHVDKLIQLEAKGLAASKASKMQET